MKRFLTLLFATLLIAAVLCVSASASDSNAVAENLSAIGMFRVTANSYTDTTFAPLRPCSSQNYAVFLLRAPGYKDGVDFQYAGALDFAVTKGLMDISFFSGNFLTMYQDLMTQVGQMNDASAAMMMPYLERDQRGCVHEGQRLRQQREDQLSRPVQVPRHCIPH